MQQPPADLGSFIRVWFLFLLRLYSAIVCYSVITSVFRSCLLPLPFWWRARPENDFGRVCDLRMFLVVCSTWKWFLSCVRHENVWVCMYVCLGRMLTATERVILAVRSIWKRFGLVSDLRQILAMCTTCGRFLLGYSTRQRRFMLCSALERVWRCICSILERVWLYVTSFVAIFFVGLFFPSRPCRDQKGNQHYSL